MKPALVCRHARLATIASGAIQLPAVPPAIRKLPLAKRPGYELLGTTLECLRELCPAPFPVIVRTADIGPEINGCCHRTRNRFVISVSHHLDCERAVETLLHEWAHARAWNHLLDAAITAEVAPTEFDQMAHGAEFGISFAEVWRLFTGLILPGIKACNELQEETAA